MNMNFPASPTVGQFYPVPAVPGLPQYIFDGVTWNSTANFPPMTTIESLALNGGFEVSQENAANNVAVQNAGKYILDQWIVVAKHASGIMRCQQSFGAPMTGGNLITMVCSPEFATLAATDNVYLSQPFEGYRWAKLCWGTSYAMPVTVAFWITSNVSGTASLCIQNNDPTRSYNVPFTVTANVWEYKTITIPGCTDGSWPKTNTVAAYVSFVFAAGTGLRSNANQWLTGAAGGSCMASSANTNFYAAVSQHVTMCNVMMLPGIEAPSADRSPLLIRPFADELHACKRYFRYETYAAGGMWVHPIDITSIYRRKSYQFNPAMRGIPAMVVTGGTNGTFAASQPRVGDVTPWSCELQGDLTGAGYSYILTLLANARM